MSTKSHPFRGALYYPYIHIHNVDWLRANLIIFPQIQRMMPSDFLPDRDHAGVADFVKWGPNGRKPMLRPAKLSEPRVVAAQEALGERLLRDSEDPDFLKLFSREAARKGIDSNDPGFQIHIRKLHPRLKKTLLRNEHLAWQPVKAETSRSGKDYVEVHPRIGEVVMSTLAIACAQESGLHIVGDERSGDLHTSLLSKDLDGIYDAWLRVDKRLSPPAEPTERELFEFVLGIPGDLSALSVDDLRRITEDREPIDALLEALREVAATIPAMDAGPDRDTAFKDAAEQVLTKWKADRKNMTEFARAFFGKDSAKLATEFTEKTINKTLGGAVGATATSVAAGAATHAGWVGTLTAGSLVGAAAGLVLGLVTHSVSTYRALAGRERNSPYRFLTTLSDAGVVFRAGTTHARPDPRRRLPRELHSRKRLTNL